mgnify:CR=1 FL=1
MKFIFALIGGLICLTTSYSQKKSMVNSYPDKEDIELFNALLLSTSTSVYSYVRINFYSKNEKKFLITGIGPLYEFYNWKYKPHKNESLVDKFKFIDLIEKEWPLSDTIFFKTNEFIGFPKYKLYNITILEKYKRMGLQNVFEDFINEKYCFCHAWPMSLIAYLFEKKILIEYEVNSKILKNIETKYNFRWDPKEYNWNYF